MVASILKAKNTCFSKSRIMKTGQQAVPSNSKPKKVILDEMVQLFNKMHKHSHCLVVEQVFSSFNQSSSCQSYKSSTIVNYELQ